MPEAAVLSAVPARGDAAPGAALAAVTGAMAGRLARLVAALPAAAESARAGELAFLDAMAGAPAAAPPPALARLIAGLGLVSLETDLLVLAGLAEEHEGYAAVLRALHPGGEPLATIGLACALLAPEPGDRARLRAALCAAPVAGGTIRVAPDGPWFDRSLRVADALWPVLHGIDAWPAGVAPVAAAPAAGLRGWLARPPAARAAAALAGGLACTVFVSAPDARAALHRGAALADHAGVACAPLALPAELAGVAAVHALARGAVPVLEPAPPPDGEAATELGALHGHPGPVVVCVRDGAAAPAGARPLLAVPWAPLDAADRRRMWAAALPPLAAEAPLLAARHDVEPGAAADAAADAAASAALDGGAPGAGDVAAALRHRARLALPESVRLVPATAGRDRLVLATDAAARFDELLGRRRHQRLVLDDWGFLAARPGARGLRVLLTGPPGTGKTLAAEVLAHELDVDLLLVDLAGVVSKWLGETEQHLAAVFAAAERTHAVVCFDEADVLFGRRTDASDAHARYANLTTAYLLARLERFDGLAVLTTNLRRNVDPAFIRRLEAVIELGEPDRDDRVRLWRAHLPPGAPLAPDVDLAQLAHLYPIVGGLIRNAAAAAAFAAAAGGEAIGQAHLLHALRREYDKAGRAFPGIPPRTDR
jgi:hypothetical protein